MALTTLLADSAVIAPSTQLVLYCAAVGLASLAGGAVAASIKLGHRRLQIALSFVAGTMLAVGLLHLLPHAVILAIESGASGPEGLSHGALHGSLDGVALAAVIGFVLMFLLERFFHFHQHETPEEAGHHDCCDDGCSGHGAGTAKDAKSRGHAHGHGHGHAHGGRKHGHAVTQLGWIGAAIGLTLHSILEGVALAAAVLAGAEHGMGGALAGLSTFIVILLHKPFDGLTVAMLVRASGRPAAFAHVVNLLFALVVPVGAAALWFGVSRDSASLLPLALAFSAGTFLCIATSDLLPELQFHRHDRVALSTSLLLGIALATGIARLESSVAQSHDHGHDHSHDHGHDHGHDHAHEVAPQPADSSGAPADAHDHSDPNHKH
ncbi:MAG: ZIP family metal transporter [Planctomycetaceae bacterium]|nr:ZIP family metal transporter [Planctomycetaceae bacterium]